MRVDENNTLRTLIGLRVTLFPTPGFPVTGVLWGEEKRSFCVEQDDGSNRQVFPADKVEAIHITRGCVVIHLAY